MTNPLPPSVEKLATRLGVEVEDMAPVDLARAEAAIEDATALVLAEVPRRVREAWTEDAPAVVVTVVLKSARREYENPRQLNQEQLGEHMVGISATSGVFLTDRELDLIHRAADGRTGSGFIGTVHIPSAYGEGDTRSPRWNWKVRRSWP